MLIPWKSLPRILTACLMLAVVAPASAGVYRCLANGVTVFTDQPCGETPPLNLPPPTVIAPEDSAAARQYDRRIESGRRARDKADAAWSEEYREHKAQQERNRAARVAGNVVEGMTPDDVRQSLGSPDEVRDSSSGEQWVYRANGGSTRTVTFRDGAVSRISEQQRRKRK